MAKNLVFTFVDEKVSGVVELFWDNAPETCATLWKVLEKPIREKCFHAMYAGPEIMIGLPKSHQTFDPKALPGENQTVVPVPGDVLFFFQGPRMMKGLLDEFWEIGMFYGEGGRTFGPLGWTPVTMWGRMRHADLPAFAATCQDIRWHGMKTLEIKRAS